MSTPRDETPGLRMTGSVVALASIGTLAVAQGPTFERGFAVLFGVVALLRLVLGRDGRRLLPVRILQALGFSLAAVSLAYVLHRLGAGGRAGGPDALWALMEVTCLFEALVLLWRQRAFSSFLVILFSSVHATGIAFALPPGPGLAFVGAYVAVLAWTLVVFERGAALEQETPADGAVLRVRARSEDLLPWRSALGTTVTLLVFGLPVGALLYVAAPRGWELPGTLGAAARREPVDHDAGLDVLAEDDRAAAPGFVIATTGPGGGGAPLGSVAEIKRDITPKFEVSLPDGSDYPPTVILREKTADTYQVIGRWDAVLGKSKRPRIHRDMDDRRADGWIPLQHARRAGPPVTLRVDVLQGGNRRLFHQPFEVAVKIQRDGRVVTPAEILETGDEALTSRVPFETGDVVFQRYVAPPAADDPTLIGRRSDSAVAPSTVHLEVPPAVRGPLEARAREVVGAETDPWRRARKLEAWLSGPEFTYTLKVPALDRRNPIVDFVERTRSGHCEPYAYALTLMLRALGHPARYVTGFWGGDRLEERKTVIIRGSDYHAWTELYLDGLGWMPLNPTPPDRRATDAGTLTAAEEKLVPEETESSWSFDFLGLDESSWQRFWRQVGHGVDDHVLSPLAALFDGRTAYAGVWLTLLLLLFARRRQAQARMRALVVAPGRKLPEGAYGRALLLLARKGVRRPTSWTVREFARFVGRRFPDARAPFAALSRAHEARCYGGEAPEPGAERAQLDALRRALRPSAREGAALGSGAGRA